MTAYTDLPDLDDILADCLDALLRRERTLADCLAMYPEHAEALRPLLQVGLLTARLKSPPMPAASVDALEARLRDLPLPKPAAPMPSARRGFTFALSRLAAVLIIAVIVAFGSGAGLVAASSNTLPGDPLYAVKRLWEAVVLALSPLTGPPADIARWIAENRLAEIDALAAAGRLDAAALTDLTAALDRLSSLTDPADTASLIAFLEQAAARLDRIQPAPETQSAYDSARQTLIRLQASASPPPVESSPAPSATPSLTPTPLPTEPPSVTPTATVTLTSTRSSSPTRRPSANATATRTPIPTTTATALPSATPTPTFTWTPLPLPGQIQPFTPTATAPSPGTPPAETPTSDDPGLIATERVRATQQSVFLTQTAGPPSVTPSP
ncbi:MAG: hypothetical protein JNM70_20220 [Anaerolineae bacterium]|nr:hypothetical protein [Anaerolineae bacterium]